MFWNRSIFERRAFILLTLICSLFAAASGATEPADKPIKALLVLGGCCHDYKSQQQLLTQGISERAHVNLTVAYDPDTTNAHLNPLYHNPDWAAEYDVINHDENGKRAGTRAPNGRDKRCRSRRSSAVP